MKIGEKKNFGPSGREGKRKEEERERKEETKKGRKKEKRKGLEHLKLSVFKAQEVIWYKESINYPGDMARNRTDQEKYHSGSIYLCYTKNFVFYLEYNGYYSVI